MVCKPRLVALFTSGLSRLQWANVFKGPLRRFLTKQNQGTKLSNRTAKSDLPNTDSHLANIGQDDCVRRQLASISPFHF